MTTRARFALLYTAAWTPFMALYALGVAQRVPRADAVWSGVSTMGVAALLGVAVYPAARIVRARARRGWQLIAWHAALALVYTILWTTIISLMVRAAAPADVWFNYVKAALFFQFATGLALYGLLAGVFTALEANEQYREQAAAAARAEALRVRAELRALRAQLNPHFLFNTLHSITALVRSDSRAAEEALERFGMLMRHVLQIGRAPRDDVPLSEELGFVRAYLDLEKMRLGNRLRVVEEVDPEALECYILAFSLQPLVENAVRHGIAPLPQGGTLRLAASVADDVLHLEVADDGAGVDAAVAAADDGVGLQVVRQRLTARFGDAARLDITSAPNEGLRAHITMPLVLRPMSAGVSAEFAVPR